MTALDTTPGAPGTTRAPRDSSPRPHRHRHQRLRRVVVPVALLGVLALVGCLSIAVGSVTLPFGEVIDAVLGARDTQAHLIVRDLRLPRTVAGLVAGACLLE